MDGGFKDRRPLPAYDEVRQRLAGHEVKVKKTAPDAHEVHVNGQLAGTVFKDVDEWGEPTWAHDRLQGWSAGKTRAKAVRDLVARVDHDMQSPRPSTLTNAHWDHIDQPRKGGRSPHGIQLP